MSNTQVSIQDYKKSFDENNLKNDNYQIALFIKLFMDKNVKNKEIEDFTGIKKSKMYHYKRIIKNDRIEELKSSHSER